MKKTILALMSLVAAVSVHAQGTVQFANTSTTVLTVGGSPMSLVANSFRIGLYVGAAGSTEEQLTLVGTALNATAPASAAGRFNGGNPFALPSPTFPGGTAIAFQIRAWSFSAGTSFEQALATGNSSQFAGKSAIGSVTPASGGNPAPALFGATIGQIGGFNLVPIPEPSTIALALLGGALLIFRRRK